MHESTKSYDVGTTVLSAEQIIKIGIRHEFPYITAIVLTLALASLVFRRFAQSYDLLIDNCQLFSQLLAETIGGRDNVEQVRRILNKKSGMGLPIAASWLAGPAYHFMAVVHHTLPKISSTHDCGSNGFCADCSAQSLHQRLDHILEDWEKFYYHPRVYGSREKTAQDIDAMFEKLNPFS